MSNCSGDNMSTRSVMHHARYAKITRFVCRSLHSTCHGASVMHRDSERHQHGDAPLVG